MAAALRDRAALASDEVLSWLLLQFVFGTCAAGAVVLTVNVVLLGGNIGFFQSMCLLGYCLFPMDIAAIVTALTTNMIARWIVVLVCSQCSHSACEAHHCERTA